VDRCRFVNEHGNRCTRATHPEEVHVFGGPVTIPPVWWEPSETAAFVRNFSTLIMHGIVSVEEPSADETESSEFILGRLQIAARRYYEAVEAVHGYDDKPVPLGVWAEFHDARDRVLKLTDRVRDWRAAAAALAQREKVQ
jgi:hypothetical protein